jgi:2-oxoglutarate ferredoxin oxidoreductase subunit beta
VEILQDCPIFNDGSFDVLRKDDADNHLIRLRHGEPIVFGADDTLCVVRHGFGLAIANTADVDPDEIVVHDAYTDNHEYAYALSRLSDQNLDHVVTGIFRSTNRQTYDDAARAQLSEAAERKPVGADALQQLLTGKETWTVQ